MTRPVGLLRPSQYHLSRWVEVCGRVAEITAQRGAAHTDKLTQIAL